MKKTVLIAGLLSCLLITACANNNESEMHTHEDGSTHGDHAHDTTMPAQQEFTVGDTTRPDSVTTKEHSHNNGKKHSH